MTDMYLTGNPVPSADAKDRFDNSLVLDELLNGPLGEYLNRLGVPLKSWVGIMQQVTDYLIEQGYESVYLTYGAGVVVERQTQLVQRSGELYRVMNASDLPLTLTGTWATDSPKLKAVGDAALRQALGDTTDQTMGMSLIPTGIRVVDSVAVAQALTTASKTKYVRTLGYYGAGTPGGNLYEIRNTGTPNGGTVIGMTDGRRMHLIKTEVPVLHDFGCKGDWNGTTGTDDTAGYLAAVGTGRPFNIGDGRFSVYPLGPETTYPGGNEKNRTSGAMLQTGQSVFGLGAGRSELVWGGATKQAFFGMQAANDIVIGGIKFTGGYAPFIVDPTSNGSVQRVSLYRSTVDGCITGPIAGRQLALDPASKSCADISMIECVLRNIGVHGWISSNCDRALVSGCKFFAVNAGYAADFSQGNRAPKFTDNWIYGALHGFKFESSNSYWSGGTIDTDPTIAETRDGIATSNHLFDIQQYGALLNSGTNGHNVSGNYFDGSFTVAIYLGAVTGYSNPGQTIISRNIFDMRSVNSTGIRNDYIHSTMGVIVEWNSIRGLGTIGIDWRAPRGKLSSNSVTVAQVGVQLGVASKDIDVEFNTVYANAGITGTVAGDWKGLRLKGNKLNTGDGFAVYLGLVTSLSNSEVDGNKVSTGTVRTNAAILVNNPRGVMFTKQQMNLPTGSGPGIQTTGTALKCIVSQNIGTTGNSIASPDATTTSNTVNNITDATYVDYAA